MLHSRWSEYTAEEISRIKKEKCRKCKYKGTFANEVCCDYTYLTGRLREERPEDCKHHKDSQKTYLRNLLPDVKSNGWYTKRRPKKEELGGLGYEKELLV